MVSRFGLDFVGFLGFFKLSRTLDTVLDSNSQISSGNISGFRLFSFVLGSVFVVLFRAFCGFVVFAGLFWFLFGLGFWFLFCWLLGFLFYLSDFFVVCLFLFKVTSYSK